MHLTISIRDTATHSVDGLAELITSPQALSAGGVSLRDSIIRNFGKLGPNKRFPDRSTGFWGRAALSTTAPSVGTSSVTISITQIGVRQRYLGGRITPIAGNYLTIPAQADAYGKKAREIGDLSVAFMGKTSSGQPLLALVRGNPRISGKRDVMFWLVTEVDQNPDPSVLPTEDQLRRAFASGLRSFVNARLKRRAVTLDNFSLSAINGREVIDRTYTWDKK